MNRFLELSNETLFLYYLLSNLIYLFLLITAIFTSAAHQRRLTSVRLEWMKGTPLTPPITLLVPTHNEEKSIVAAVRSLLSLDYPSLEVIVINDGSADQTLGELTRHYRLYPADLLYIPEIRSARCGASIAARTSPGCLWWTRKLAGAKPTPPMRA
jgi:cellulose synthase/poly-beta-1,6-N-acetylglucosamine synthase-like glycosyltransferase